MILFRQYVISKDSMKAKRHYYGYLYLKKIHDWI